MTALRPLPALERARTICEGCGQQIVWAITLAGPNGRGGKMMPLDPCEDLTGNVAVAPVSGGRLTARVLHRGEQFDRPLEYAGMTHFATCPTRTKPELPPEVVDLQLERAKRRGRGRSRAGAGR